MKSRNSGSEISIWENSFKWQEPGLIDLTRTRKQVRGIGICSVTGSGAVSCSTGSVADSCSDGNGN